MQGRERIYLDRFWNEFGAHPERIDEATRAHYAALYALPGAMHSAFAQFLAFPQDAIDNQVPSQTKLTIPVLALGGEKSFGLMMADVMRFAASDVRAGIVPDSGHWIMEENPTATVALGYERGQVAHPLEGSGFVVPRVERSPLLAATWVTSKWPNRAPEGHVLLRGFLGGGRDPRRLDATDEELVSMVVDELAQLLAIKGSPLVTRLFRWTKQSPQYEVGHLQRVATIERQLAAIPGVFITGSGFRAIGIPDCIADGRETAAKAASFVAAQATKL